MIITDKPIINAFGVLGDTLRDLMHYQGNEDHPPLVKKYSQSYHNLIILTSIKNHWFTAPYINIRLQQIVDELRTDHLNITCESLFPQGLPEPAEPKKVAIILSGNSPLYGFSEMLLTLLSGHIFIGKTTSDDNDLLKLLAAILKDIMPELHDKIIFEDGLLKKFDYLIARKTRLNTELHQKYLNKHNCLHLDTPNPIGIITGKEKQEELSQFGHDIFNFFGRSSQNIKKILIPERFEIPRLLDAIQSFEEVSVNDKYFGQYEYIKSMYLINKNEHLDNGFLIVSRDNGANKTGTAILLWEKYSDEADLLMKLKQANNTHSLLVSSRSWPDETTVFPGTSCTHGLVLHKHLQELAYYLTTL